jgi:hypothetical protein
MAAGAFSLAALGAVLPASTRGLAVASSSSCSNSSSSPAAALAARSSSNVGYIGAVSLRHSLWVGQKAQKKRVSRAVFAAVAVEEAAAGPPVNTEAVPRPKKVGKGVVRLRLTRLGRKKRPFFRIVATHCSWRRDGKYIELLGHYNPLHGISALACLPNF